MSLSHPSGLERLVGQLDDTDRQIIETIGRYRLVCARQLRRLYFPSPVGTETAVARRARHRMARLVKLDLLARLPRRVGGFEPGSAGYVYRLAPLGLRLAQTKGTRNREWAPGPAWVRHNLAITESFVRLKELERDGLISLLGFDPEPHCWRTFNGASGQSEILKPDAYTILRAHGYEAHWFLELDRGTESKNVLRAKCDRYLQFFQTGQEQERLGLFPQIRFIVTLSGSPTLQTEAERVAEIQTVIGTLPEMAQRLFAAATLDDLTDRIRAGPDPQ